MRTWSQIMEPLFWILPEGDYYKAYAKLQLRFNL
jgi:hypothetical protein